jgi:hypothetical protein
VALFYSLQSRHLRLRLAEQEPCDEIIRGGFTAIALF